MRGRRLPCLEGSELLPEYKVLKNQIAPRSQCAHRRAEGNEYQLQHVDRRSSGKGEKVNDRG